MSSSYTVAGILAALTGNLISNMLQNPWVLGSFSFVFVLLAFSMFGFYELQLPASMSTNLTQYSNRLKSGKFIGVFAMGALSALIVSPCVAAPLAGALIFISKTHDIFLGGTALFSLSLGMGVPLLIIGASAGMLLPKAGNWMNVVKNIFGVLMLGLSIWIVSPILNQQVTLYLYAILIIISSVYLGAFNQIQAVSTGWMKLQKGIALVLLLLAPMVYGLYQQYGAEGPRFFFWTQSFGRITGENFWKNDAGYFFFVHTFLWAFLPFSIVTYWAAGHWAVQIVKSTFNAVFANKMLLLAGFILPFTALSTSHYKLPHYIFVVGPFAALITAQYLLELKPVAQKVFTGIGVLVILAAIALTALFCLWFFPLNNTGLWVVIVGLFGFTIWLFAVNKGLERLVFPPLLALAVFNFVMNTHIYPALLTYHSSSVMAEYVNEHSIPKDKLRFTKALGHAFEFYAQTIIPETTTDAIAQQSGDIWLTTNDEGRNELIVKGIPIKEEVVFNHFHIVMLTGKFLNPATRAQVLEKRYLLHIVK